uniref:rRNA adenine N(6)-methyltransferase n=1 Tax=Nannospalax galili TaxID=1026970 RepID=A0A8C6REZ2_NANGA
MWGPALGLPPRLTLSVLGPGRCCILGSGASMRKDLRGRNRRGFSDFHPQPLSDLDCEESPSWVSKSRSEPTRHVTSKKLAKALVGTLLGHYRPSRQLLLECNPGPGILTEALLKAGAKVVALESGKTFIPHLESLRKILDGELQVVHCDFFKMDPRNQELIRPELSSHKLFQNLGVKAAAWSAGVPLKIFGILPSKYERKILWKIVYDLYSCASIYRYGRIELNLFIGDREFKKLTATPQRPDLYHVLSVLWQVACEIKILRMEHWSSFGLYTESGHLEKSNAIPSYLLMERLFSLRISLFCRHLNQNLNPINYDIFFHMVKHCFGKRNAPLLHHLRSLSTVDPGDILRQIRRNPGETVLRMYPQDFKRLFEAIEQSEETVFKWVYDESLDDIVI